MKSELKPVILTTSIAGSGLPGDPVRHVKEAWSLDGELLISEDPETCAALERVTALRDRIAELEKANAQLRNTIEGNEREAAINPFDSM